MIHSRAYLLLRKELIVFQQEEEKVGLLKMDLSIFTTYKTIQLYMCRGYPCP